MAGGAGTRLWPVSRGNKPKQLINVLRGKSLLQLSYDRLRGLLPPERIFVCTGAAHAQAVMENLPDLPKEKWDNLYKLYGSCRTADELIAKYEDLMEGIADLPFVSGFCYTQLTDIEQERNGLLTYDRQPKVDPDRIAEINRLFFAGR